MLFALRNSLETLGYRYVESPTEADMVATIDADDPYQEIDVPPTLTSVRRYIPPKTITTYGSIYGDIYGSYTGTATIPGETYWETAVLPGYTFGRFFPMVSVTIADRNDPERVWVGTGVGFSKHQDVRVSSQFVLAEVMSRFPKCVHRWDRDAFALEPGHDGSHFMVMTNNGNDFCPTIIQIDRGSPAARGGLRMFDMLIAVDGHSLRNKSAYECAQLFAGEPGTPVTYHVKRLSKEFDVTITRGPAKR